MQRPSKVKKSTSPRPRKSKDPTPKTNGSVLHDRIRDVKQRARKRASGRPTSSQSNLLRETLIHAALSSFMKRGFEGASLESIARDAKVAKITIYRQFGGKAELFREVVHYAQSAMQTTLNSAVAVDGPPERVLRIVIARLRDVFTSPDFLEVLRMQIAAAPRFPKIASLAMTEIDYTLGPLIGFLQGLKDKRLIKIRDAREAAIQLSAVAAGGVRYLLVKRTPHTDAGKHWVESVYSLFAPAWGLTPPRLTRSRLTSHL